VDGSAPTPGAAALLVGAHPQADFALKDPRSSSYHAVVWGRQGIWRVVDLRSTNGTYVDGARIDRIATFGPSSRIRFASEEYAAADLTAACARAPLSTLYGRDPSDDIYLDAPVVSRHHALVRRIGESMLVVDLASANGVSLGSPQSRIDRVATSAWGTALFAGSYRFVPVDFAPGPAIASSQSAQGLLRADRGRPMVVGRAPGCDLVVDAPQVSSRHCRLTPEGNDIFRVEDLGSTNGTWVNGRRVGPGGERMRVGDTLGLGSYVLRVEAGRALRAARGLRLDALSLRRMVPHRKTGVPFALLDNVSLAIYPGELVALMGPSGAGKSTLMMALNGYEPPSSGRVLVNGEDLFRNYDRFRMFIGYVPQDDIIPPELTVAESLYYTARLRLPPDTSDAEIHRRIDTVLQQLGIFAQRDQIIGSAEAKVLSGGQRKRVNLAQELITDPTILLLDEPTSGLSSQDAAEVVDALRRFADQGRTALVTIHQPSAAVFKNMDHLAMLAPGGRLAYFGPTDPDAYDYFGATSPTPEQLFEKLDTQSPEHWQNRYKQSPHCKRYVTDRLDEAPCADTTQEVLARQRPAAGGVGQWVTLCRRYALAKVRDQTNVFITALQAPVVAILLGAIFHGAENDVAERPTPIFLAIVAAIFFGCFNASREIVRERTLYRRERMVNLGIGPYLFSKFFVLGAAGLAQAGILALALRWLVGTGANVLVQWGVLGLTTLASTAMGLLLSALVAAAKKGSSESAMALVPIVLIPQIVLAGFLTPMNQPGKTYIGAAAAPMVSRWATQALFELERRALCPAQDECCHQAEALDDLVACLAGEEERNIPTPICMDMRDHSAATTIDMAACLSDDQVQVAANFGYATLSSKGHRVGELRTSIAILAAFLFLFLALAALTLRTRAP
jgi:ABC-type multidrug transport system ATPase subunit/pSer/pThr/pTyr-binding forkhead associated (FHA) protein